MLQTGKIQHVLAELKVSSLSVSEDLRKRVIGVVRECIDAFAATPNDFGRTSVVTHTIKTGEAQPFRHKLRPIPFARRQFLEQEVERLLMIGAISPADPGACPYASRTVLAEKKDKTWRMCVDYRDLNAQTEKDAFPLPRIDQVWPALAKAKCFASLDLLMGYHQVGMEPRDRYKTAFLTHRGLYVYNVMPFGLCNAPATFQRLMEKVLGPLINHGVLVYLDDVLLYAEDANELIDLLRKVLKLLNAAGLKCKASKCSLFAETIQYLGHVVSSQGIRPETVKLDKILQWPRPETGVGLAGFLGFCNYYRDLVPAFANASDSLYKASKAKTITWTPELATKFEELKKLMLMAPVVRLPKVEESFILETDASQVALGAVMKQRFLDTGLEHPVGFFSKALSGSERNYSAYELEMYAVVRAVEHFRMFLLGREFLLRTDHAALGKLLHRDIPPTSRVERWILRLSEYVFRIEHQPGAENVVADVLSRLPFASGEQASTSGTVSSGQGSARNKGNSTAPARSAAVEVPLQQGVSALGRSNAKQRMFEKSRGSNGSALSVGLSGMPEASIESAKVGNLIQLKSHTTTGTEMSRGSVHRVRGAEDPSCCATQMTGSSAISARGGCTTSVCCMLWSLDEDGDGSSAESDRSSDYSSSECGEDASCDDFELNTAWLFMTPELDLPISREGLSVSDLETPSVAEFVAAQLADTDLSQLREWVVQNKTPAADEIAKFGERLKELAQLREQIRLREDVLVIRRGDDQTNELILVPVSMVERIIRILHEGVGAAHQAAKATAARLIRRFYWPGLKRDVRLYVACCPVCEEFLRCARTPKAALNPMEVGGRGDCLAMDIVGGGDSLPTTSRGAKYILTFVDCFTRYAFAVPLNDQSSEAVINAVIGNYITVHGSPRRILTDQGKCFESALFHSFCKFFRISKIRTSGYRPQSNGLCERFNQTLKHSLSKILGKALQPSWDLYLNFAVFSYNTSTHSSTGFTPHFLTFGCEARLPADLIFGVPELSSLEPLDGVASSGSLNSLFKSFSLLHSSFSLVRENLGFLHRREKDRYDLGAVERVFHPGDTVRVRLKARQPGPSKFQSGWSGPHEVVDTRGVIVTVREASSGRVYKTHHDRLSNPVFSRKFAPRFLEGSVPRSEDANANPEENLEEPEEDLEPAVNPEFSLQRSRYGRVVKPRRDPDFDYSNIFLEDPFLQSDASISNHFFMFHFTNTSHASTVLQPTPPDAAAPGRSLAQLRRDLIDAGERPFFVETPAGPQWMVMLRGSGTIMVYSPELRTFCNPPTETLLEDLTPDYVPWPRRRIYRALTQDEVQLPSSVEDFPGCRGQPDVYLQPRYGYTTPWLESMRDLARANGRMLPQLQITAPPGGVMGTTGLEAPASSSMAGSLQQSASASFPGPIPGAGASQAMSPGSPAATSLSLKPTMLVPDASLTQGRAEVPHGGSAYIRRTGIGDATSRTKPGGAGNWWSGPSRCVDTSAEFTSRRCRFR